MTHSPRPESSPNLLILRHSERLDESDKKLWWETVDTCYPREGAYAEWKWLAKEAKEAGKPIPQPPRYSTAEIEAYRQRVDKFGVQMRDYYSFSADPPLSEPRGLEYADHAANTIALYLQRNPHFTPRIYASRAQRAIQTAVPLARRLNLPVVLSAGLCSLIVVIERRQIKHRENPREVPPFDFLSTEALQRRFPDVTFLDGDSNANPSSDHPNIPPGGLNRDDWKEALNSILSFNSASNDSNSKSRILPIVVAHRETIKGLAQQQGVLPYCTIALFSCMSTSKNSRTSYASILQSSSATSTPRQAAAATGRTRLPQIASTTSSGTTSSSRTSAPYQAPRVTHTTTTTITTTLAAPANPRNNSARSSLQSSMRGLSITPAVAAAACAYVFRLMALADCIGQSFTIATGGDPRLIGQKVKKKKKAKQAKGAESAKDENDDEDDGDE